jgi:hypothetical protein
MHRRHFLQFSGAAGSLWLAGQLKAQTEPENHAGPKSKLSAAPGLGPQDSNQHEVTRAGPGREPILFLRAPSPDAELDLALQRLGLPVQREAPLKDFAVAEVVAGNGSRQQNALRREDAPASEEAYRVAQGASGSIRIVSRTPHGLANGLYDLRRSLLVSGSTDALAGLLTEGVHAPHFAHRVFYHFLTSWGLQRLTGGALTPQQWRDHLDRMRALNANQFVFDIWSDQYYHPDYPETFANRALYDRLREACDYAHRLGLRTAVTLFPAQVPASVYQANPQAQAVEAQGYHGINMCPVRAWNLVTSFNVFLLSYFGRAVDDLIVELQDPGSCLCKLCCGQFPELVLRFMQLYRSVPGGPPDRRIDLCTLHFRDWLESPGQVRTGVAFPIEDLRKRVFEVLSPGVLVHDIDADTLDMAGNYHLKRCYFFFDLDPESGLDSEMVFPRVMLKRIDSQIRESVQNHDDGILAYRVMPFAQYVADFVLFRKCWDPRVEVDTALVELAAEWNIPGDHRLRFVAAMRLLDDWRQNGKAGLVDDAAAALDELAGNTPVSDYLIDLEDVVRVLRVLAHFAEEHRDLVKRPEFYPPPDLVDQVNELMLNRRIFEAFTVHQHWIGRSKEMIGQHIRWWLRAFPSARA